MREYIDVDELDKLTNQLAEIELDMYQRDLRKFEDRERFLKWFKDINKAVTSKWVKENYPYKTNLRFPIALVRFKLDDLVEAFRIDRENYWIHKDNLTPEVKSKLEDVPTFGWA